MAFQTPSTAVVQTPINVASLDWNTLPDSEVSDDCESKFTSLVRAPTVTATGQESSFRRFTNKLFRFSATFGKIY